MTGRIALSTRARSLEASSAADQARGNKQKETGTIFMRLVIWNKLIKMRFPLRYPATLGTAAMIVNAFPHETNKGIYSDSQVPGDGR
jgi:hypothetical protein